MRERTAHEARGDPRPRRHRQLHHLGADRPRGAHRVELPAALRRRPDLPCAGRRAPPRRDARVLAIELDGFSRSEQDYARQHRRAGDAALRPNGTAIEITDFCPRFERAGASSARRCWCAASRRWRATPRIRVQCPPVVRLRRADARASPTAATTSATSAPDRVLRLTTDAPVTYVLAETPFLLDGAAGFVLGADETLRGSGRQHRARVPGADRRLLARLGAPPGDAARMAGRGDPRRDHAQAVHVRGNRRDRRRDDHQHSRGARTRSATGTTAIAGCATPSSSCARSTRLSDVDTMENYLRYLANIVGSAERRPPAAGVRHRPGAQPGRARGASAGRLSRHGAGARRQPGLRAHPARRLRQRRAGGDAGVLRPAPAAAARRRPTSSGSSASASGPSRCTTRPTPACGSCARARACTPRPALMCWAACDRLARIAAHLGADGARAAWRDARAGDSRRHRGAGLEPRAGRFVESFGGDDVEAGLLLMAEVGFVPPDDPRFVGTVDAHRAAAAARRAPVPLRGGRRFRRARRPPSTSARSGTSTRWRDSAASAEARELFEGMLALPQPPRPAVRGHRPRRPASSGATIRRPTRWSASSTRRCGCRAAGRKSYERPGRLVVVSNRVGPVRGAAAAGGLAVALVEALRERGGLWFGWSGRHGAGGPGAAARRGYRGPDAGDARPDAARATRATTTASANRCLWPLLHFRIDLMRFRARRASTATAASTAASPQALASC